MKVRQVIIKDRDLKKLMEEKGIKSVRQLSKVAGVEYTYLTKCASGKLAMSQSTWDKIKICL